MATMRTMATMENDDDDDDNNNVSSKLKLQMEEAMTTAEQNSVCVPKLVQQQKFMARASGENVTREVNGALEQRRIVKYT